MAHNAGRSSPSCGSSRVNTEQRSSSLPQVCRLNCSSSIMVEGGGGDCGITRALGDAVSAVEVTSFINRQLLLHQLVRLVDVDPIAFVDASTILLKPLACLQPIESSSQGGNELNPIHHLQRSCPSRPRSILQRKSHRSSERRPPRRDSTTCFRT